MSTASKVIAQTDKQMLHGEPIHQVKRFDFILQDHI